MTEPTDDLLARLEAADPVEASTLPNADDPGAQQVLSGILDDSRPVVELPQVAGLNRYGRDPRRWRTSLMAAAAVFILVAGFVLFSPDNTTPALAAVHQAARTTAEVDSGRVSTIFTLEGTDGTSSETVSGELQGSFSGADVAFEVNFEEGLEDDLVGNDVGLPSTVEGRMIDGILYGYDGGQWYSVDTGGLIGQQLVDFIDPRSVLETVEELIETEEVGPATVNGVATTQYRSIVDLGGDSLAGSGWLALQQVDIEADGEIIVDLYVDGDGVLRQFDITGDVQAPEGEEGAATFLVQTTFFDLGADISIEAPAAEDISELFDAVGDELELDLSSED